jgi:hypothetical protein
MDNFGNAHLIWTQKASLVTDPWRIYTRYFCMKTAGTVGSACTGGTGGWTGVSPAALTIDAGQTPPTDYFGPVIGMEAFNSNYGAPACGQDAGCGNALSVFDAMIRSSILFYIDTVFWAPP